MLRQRTIMRERSEAKPPSEVSSNTWTTVLGVDARRERLPQRGAHAALQLCEPLCRHEEHTANEGDLWCHMALEVITIERAGIEVV